MSFDFDCLGYQRGFEEIREALFQSEKIKYRANGNRTGTAEQLWKRIEPILPKVGVTRIAELSQLSPYSYPVFQSTRPNTNYHHSCGMNSGSQGKGPTRTQAMISCAMESIEGFCCEPRSVQLKRGSYNWLRRHLPVIDPGCLHIVRPHPEPIQDEPLMWTSAYSVNHDCEVWVPAESVYFPFLPKMYHTRDVFAGGTNGVASGATYLEAVNHALYEVIERSYNALFKNGLLDVRALYEHEIPHISVRDFYKHTNREYEIQLFSFCIPWIKENLPVFFCLLLSSQKGRYGTGCAGDIHTSVQRALSEAMQAVAVTISGSREDIRNNKGIGTRAHIVSEKSGGLSSLLPTERELRYKDLPKRMIDKKFADLRDEFKFLRKWLAGMGCPEILIANLTRTGIDIPVVKVMVPGLPFESANAAYPNPYETMTERLYSCKMS